VPGLIVLSTVGIAVALHPARREFLVRGAGFSPGLAAIAALWAGPLLAYALSMSEQARELSGPPHDIQRLTTMAAMAIAVGLVMVLAAFQTRGWRISAWCVGAAALVLGLGFLLFPNYRGSAGGGWGVFAAGSGLLLIVVAEVRAKRDPSRREPG
jgi:peptidoglycan/LPS O-acetylase OafA/YrhL